VECLPSKADSNSTGQVKYFPFMETKEPLSNYLINQTSNMEQSLS
jgi:hypothetical protein